MFKFDPEQNNWIVPPGWYYLGDPCYCFDYNTPSWNQLLQSSDHFENNSVGECERGPVLSFFTYYGDGVYYDQFDQEYGVDSGMIGLVPLYVSETTSEWSHLVIFNEEVRAWYDKDGALHFGEHVIHTGYVEDPLDDVDEQKEWHDYDPDC